MRHDGRVAVGGAGNLGRMLREVSDDCGFATEAELAAIDRR